MHAPEPQRPDPDHPSADLLIWAYRRGMFPMAAPRSRADPRPAEGRLEWYSPDPRGVIPLEGFRIPASLRRIVRRGDFEIASDVEFEQVMRACAAPRRRGGWINERLIEAYVELHRRGSAHSIEARRGGRLVGGLYGVHIGGAFFGESMFVRPELGGTNASKVCLVFLVRWLRIRGFALMDTQFRNRHLEQFGCIDVPRERYLADLARAVDLPVTWGRFEALDEPPP